MTFKKFDNQETVKVVAKLAASTANWKPGDLFSYVPSTGVAANITKASEVETALGAGSQVYMVAQSDQITEATPLAYKTYNISDVVAMSTTAKTVVAYKVTDVENIVGYAKES